MKNSKMIILVIILGAIFYGTSSYNGFVSQEQGIDAQWAQVETQYQRRYDLIPNLVNTAKGYMNHEETIFTQLAQARELYARASTASDKEAASEKVEGALGRLIAVAENYPNLKANQTMLALMDELAGSENRVATEKMRFNEKVRVFNIGIRQMPAKLVAKIFGFQERVYLKSEKAAHEAPKVEFS